MRKIVVYVGMITLGLSACQSAQESSQGELPILGRREVVEKVVNGETQTDTVYHQIANFNFVNQDSMSITNADVSGKVYVADFFFTSCPTICPVMKTQMLRVYEAFKDQDDFAILSHTIDPEYDTVALLKDYALRLGVNDASTWHFLTGDKEHIYEIGQQSYMVTAGEDKDEPGGYIHSGAFILVDPHGHIRGIYDGTEANQVDKLINDIPKLLHEFESKK